MASDLLKGGDTRPSASLAGHGGRRPSCRQQA